MKLRQILSAACLCAVSVMSAQSTEDCLSYALSQSGSNRANLESVLSHYRNDSLKYKAACFLIENMSGYYSLKSPDVSQYYDYLNKVFTDTTSYTNDQYRSAYHVAMNKLSDYPKNCVKEYDLSVVTSEYLIRNIDSAYDMWQKNSHNFSFDTFCNYILPHRINNEPLSSWRETYMERYGKELDTYFRKQYNYYFPYTVCNHLNKDFNGAVFYPPRQLPDFSLSDLLNVKIGSCDAYSARSVSQLRSFGYPVTIDFVPQWGNRSMGHSWSALFVSDNYTVPFGVNETLGSQFDERSDLTIPKVYRQTYAHQQWLSDICNDKVSHVPSLFKNECYIDVTDKYVETSDVMVNFTGARNMKDVRWAYLSVFNNRTWIPVAFASLKDGNAEFTKLGRNIVYLPYYIDAEGKSHSSTPFILDVNGKVKQLIADDSKKESILLSRKYKESEVLNKYNGQIRHSSFVVSNDRGFQDSVIVATLDSTDGNRYYTIPLTYEGKYKYFKFISAKDSYGNIAEIQLFDDAGKMIKPQNVYGGWSGTEGHNFDKVYDGNVLTSYSRIVPDGAWAAVELETPMHISKIRVHPRSDGNSINAGDRYQLFFWEDDHWHMLGEQIGGYDDFLRFDNVPRNSLFLLHNASGGTEERIFTYENGKQVWW